MGLLLLVAATIAALTTPLGAQEGAEAPELFWPSDGSLSLDEADDDPVVRRRGALQADFDMLHRLAPPGGDYSFRPISVGWIRLLDGTEWVKVSIDSRTETDYGVRLTGSLVDDYGILVLVVHDDIIAGQMRTMRDVFRITTDLRVREFIVTQLDPTRFAQDDLQLPDDTPSETRRNPPFQDDPSSTHDGGSEIRVLVAYTSTLKARRDGLRGVQLLADDLLIGSADAAFMGSDVDADLTLAGLIEVDYVKLGDPNQDLQRLQDDSDGFLDNLHSERDRLDADLVFLIVDERWTVLRDGRHLPVCGDAYTYTGLSSFSDYAFAVSSVDEECDMTFVHELGHLMGLGHSPDDPGPEPYLP